MENLIFSQERNLNESINITFAFLKQEFRLFSKAVLFIAGPIILLSSIFYTAWTFFTPKLTNTPFTVGFFSFFNFSLSIEYFFNLLLSMFSISILGSVTNSYVWLYKSKGKENFYLKDIKDLSLKKFLSFWLLSFLVLSITAFSFLLIIPGIYVIVALSICYPVYMNENIQISDTIPRCFSLIKQNWWKTMLLILVFIIISFIIEVLFFIPQTILRSFFQVNGINSFSASIFFSIFSTIGIFLSNITYTFLFLGLSFHYFSLMESSESTSLQNRIKEINID